jgi:hypothetical protein
MTGSKAKESSPEKDINSGSGQAISEAGEDTLTASLSELLVGQTEAIQKIVPYVQMFQAGLAPEGRPAGIFMLLGPTGTGKTRTVEALAEALHGSPKKMLKIDCGEFQMEHEIAKLVGAPPGYLGHRETQPMLSQQKLNGACSENCSLAIVLFDEIEKAAGSMQRILLGIMDKANLHLGDNSSVNFENTLIFFTSNLGAQTMMKLLKPNFGLAAYVPRDPVESEPNLNKIGTNAVRRKFSPEFVNRIDSVITYQPLSAEALEKILSQQLEELQDLIDRRLGTKRFQVDVPLKTRQLLLKLGTSVEFGARELKRTLQRLLVQPLAVEITKHKIEPGSKIVAEIAPDGASLALRIADSEKRADLKPVDKMPERIVPADTNRTVQVAPAANDSTKCDRAPQIGDLIPDKGVYAGFSPDTWEPMYTTPKDAPLNLSFNQATKYAADLVAHGHRDWRVPTIAELNMLFNNRAALGGFDESDRQTGWYWSSSMASAPDSAQVKRFRDGKPGFIATYEPLSLRCIRG